METSSVAGQYFILNYNAVRETTGDSNPQREFWKELIYTRDIGKKWLQRDLNDDQKYAFVEQSSKRWTAGMQDDTGVITLSAYI